jgi:DNA-binding NtrC family response regulator
VQAFIEETCTRNGFALKTISPGALQTLGGLEWTGNVRELRNIVERLVIMARGPVIDMEDLSVLSFTSKESVDDLIQGSQSFQDFKDRAEAAFIRHQLNLHGWNVSRTAEALEMERSHLYTKIKKYGLEREGKEGEIE